MKAIKILFLGISTVLLSCGPSELNGGVDIITDWLNDIEDVHYDDKTYVTPPEWIIGVWYADNTEYWRAVEFTSSDVINYYYSGGYKPSSLNSFLNRISWGEYEKTLIDEIATDSTYFFSVRSNNILGKPIHNTLYQKISNDSILYILSGANDDIRKYGKRD